jgi:Neprosin
MPVVVQPIIDFKRFVGSLHEASPRAYLGTPHSRIADERTFHAMRKHLTDYYSDVESKYSFLDSGGRVFDCIPIVQQVSLRGRPGRLPEAPRLPEAEERADRVATPAMQLHAHFRDLLGNQMLAPADTIPVRRLTLAEISEFRNLQAFLDRVQPPAAPPPGAVDALHSYAVAEQLVANVGGSSILNVWDPQIPTGALMSLGQVWFTAGAGLSEQTVEAGWQVNPGRYGHTQPVLFTYWTADGYHSTGCYNLTCTGFVQTNGNWMLGGALPFWSSPNGPQAEFHVAFYLHNGQWWLFVEGDPVGYFPTPIYNGGAITNGATRIVFGGETATTDNMTWPPMGSGGPSAAAQWGAVAYQRRMRYFPPGGGSQDPQLATKLPSPWCYAATLSTYGAPWSKTLWYGGTGGNYCAPI